MTPFRILACAITITMFSALCAGQTRPPRFNVLHSFTVTDGVGPSGLVRDAAGNLYGTAYTGGAYSCGTVFKLSPNIDGSWTFRVIYNFDCSNGAYPNGGLIFDAAGNLYGTTYGGASTGTAFKLAPTSDGTWTETTIYAFGFFDGASPQGGVIFDAAGNLYGTGSYGGAYGKGAVYKLTPNSDGTWSMNVICSFNGYSLGATPQGNLIFDAAGNLYGTTSNGGAFDGGTAFKLTPNSDGSWTALWLHRFGHNNDGLSPQAGLILDAAGNLYGTTYYGGPNKVGTVFKLTESADESWKETMLRLFIGGTDGGHPHSALIFDAAGSLYGTTYTGGAYALGTIFKLQPRPGGGWKETVLHSFSGGTDGESPLGDLMLDPAGNLYGSSGGGDNGYGVVFELER